MRNFLRIFKLSTNFLKKNLKIPELDKEIKLSKLER